MGQRVPKLPLCLLKLLKLRRIIGGVALIDRDVGLVAERPFRCPMVPLVPLLGIGFCLLLMFSLPVENWWRLIIWLGLGFVVYFSYGRHHSVLAKRRAASAK